jgi:hypothetical protein
MLSRLLILRLLQRRRWRGHASVKLNLFWHHRKTDQQRRSRNIREWIADACITPINERNAVDFSGIKQNIAHMKIAVTKAHGNTSLTMQCLQRSRKLRNGNVTREIR